MHNNKIESIRGQAARPDSLLPPMNDSELADEFARLVEGEMHVLCVANKYTVAVFSSPEVSGPWTLNQRGEFGDACSQAIKTQMRSKRFWWGTTDLPTPENTDISTLDIKAATGALVKSWMKDADSVTGRMGHASPKVKQEVVYLAANRCQFSGCGKDLGKHTPTGRKGVYSYFAHIVAASIDGPRGDSIESKLLAENPSNFLLLCDECHRLIDKVAPSEYTVSILRAMRDHSIREVNRLLANLCYPDVDRIYLFGNVTGQMPHINDRDVDEALWASKLRASSKVPESFFYFGGQNHAPHEDSYWSAVFQTLRLDLPQVQARLSGIRTGGIPRPRLAIFPFHGTSVLVLAGRLLGDMPGTYLFQPHRNIVGTLDETRWAWPSEEPVPPLNKFRINTLKMKMDGVTEANLVVSLTFPIKSTRMSESSASGNDLKIPTLEISVEDFGHSTIRHPTDLVMFGKAVDVALKKLQDEWGIQKIHLYIGAPVTAVLTIGQKMQARHHAAFICYESLPGSGTKFVPTIEISSQEVKAVSTGLVVPLQT